MEATCSCKFVTDVNKQQKIDLQKSGKIFSDENSATNSSIGWGWMDEWVVQPFCQVVLSYFSIWIESKPIVWDSSYI